MSPTSYQTARPRIFMPTNGQQSSAQSPAAPNGTNAAGQQSRGKHTKAAAASTPTPGKRAQKNQKSTLVRRVGSTGFIQLEAESFRSLDARQKALAYWL